MVLNKSTNHQSYPPVDSLSSVSKPTHPPVNNLPVVPANSHPPTATTVLITQNKQLAQVLCTQLSLTTYQAHDILLLEHLDLPKPLPFQVAYNSQLNVLHCCIFGGISREGSNGKASKNSSNNPDDLSSIYFKSQEFLQFYTVLGMLKMALPESTIVFVHLDASITKLSIANSIASPNLRPLYFDMLLDFKNQLTEISNYSDADLHSFFTIVNKYWQSHQNFLLLVPSFFIGEEGDAKTSAKPSQLVSLQQLQTLLISFVQALSQLPITSRLNNAAIQWLFQAKKNWRLSTTEVKQLLTLLEGQQDNFQPTKSIKSPQDSPQSAPSSETLPETLQQLVTQLTKTAEEKAKLFQYSKELLTNALH